MNRPCYYWNIDSVVHGINIISLYTLAATEPKCLVLAFEKGIDSSEEICYIEHNDELCVYIHTRSIKHINGFGIPLASRITID